MEQNKAGMPVFIVINKKDDWQDEADALAWVTLAQTKIVDSTSTSQQLAADAAPAAERVGVGNTKSHGPGKSRVYLLY